MKSLFHRKLLLSSAVMAELVCLCPGVAAQSRAMCYQNAAASGTLGRVALQDGILILFVPAVFFFCGILSLLYKRARCAAAPDPTSSRPKGAAFQNRPRRQARQRRLTRLLAVLIGALCLCVGVVRPQTQTDKNLQSAQAGQATAAKPAVPQGAPTPQPSPTYVGAEACSQCHYDKFVSYQNQPHSMSKDPRTPAAHEGCESCHGAGSNHVEGGGGRDVGGLMNFSKTLPTANKNAPCLQCHTTGYVALWRGSKHDEAKLACVDCHQIHGGNPKLLAQPTQQQLCTRCHQQIRASLLKSSHHPLREEKMFCTDCHNPHGTQTERLIAANSINDKCYECHPEKRGPFIWEHPPVRENCINCHDAHGTANEPLLVMKNPLLCQRCHSDAFHPGQLLALPAGSKTTVYQQPGMLQYRACTNCHVMIHGSNHPSGKFFHR